MPKPFDAYLWATNLCAKQECCEADIRQKLRLKKDMTPDGVDSLINQLFDEGYLNEERYVRAFINDKFRFARWGRVKIAYTLRMKGFADSLIHPLLDEVISNEAYEEAVEEFLTAKRRVTSAPDSYTLRQKLLRSALSRGFEAEIAMRHLNDLDEYETPDEF